MVSRLNLIIYVLAALLAAGCAVGETPEAVQGDGGALNPDAGPDVSNPDAGGPDPDTGDKDTGPTYTPPNLYYQTSGGGLSTSGEYRLQMNFGAPMPRGTSSNGEYRIQFGPVSP